MTSADAAPLAVAVPLLASAGVAALVSLKAQRAAQAIAIAAAAATAVLCAVLLHTSRTDAVVYWFGGWHPRHGVAIGVDFAVDPLGAGFALLAALLVTTGLIAGIRYFEGLGQVLFSGLMLILLAGIVGFSLSGDLFNMFGFFEVVNVTAIALTVHQNEEEAPIQGAVNFLVANAAGAIMILVGIGLLYGHTGALNLAQIGRATAADPDAAAVVVGLAVIGVGLFTKAGLAPFHFWLVDAYAAAPAPVAVVFPGVMCELGLLGFVRVMHLATGATLNAHASAMSDVLLAGGAVTAVVGAVGCLVQQHLKRLIAFATVAHIGAFMVGIGLLDPEGLSGTAIWVVGDAFAKAALFIVAGHVLRSFGTADIGMLHGRGRTLPAAGVCFALGALVVSAVPPTGVFVGKSVVDAAAETAGDPWVPYLLLAVSALVGGSLLAAGGRVFLGIGVPVPTRPREGDGGEPSGSRRPGVVLLLPGILLAAAFLMPLVPDLTAESHRAAEHVTDRSSYAAHVLDGTPQHVPLPEVPGLKPKDWALGFAATAGALAVAAASLLGARRLGELSLGRAAVRLLRAPYTGRTGDQVAWMLVGAAAFTTAVTFAAR